MVTTAKAGKSDNLSEMNGILTVQPTKAQGDMRTAKHHEKQNWRPKEAVVGWSSCLKTLKPHQTTSPGNTASCMQELLGSGVKEHWNALRRKGRLPWILNVGFTAEFPTEVRKQETTTPRKNKYQPGILKNKSEFEKTNSTCHGCCWLFVSFHCYTWNYAPWGSSLSSI